MQQTTRQFFCELVPMRDGESYDARLAELGAILSRQGVGTADAFTAGLAAAYLSRLARQVQTVRERLCNEDDPAGRLERRREALRAKVDAALTRFYLVDDSSGDPRGPAISFTLNGSRFSIPHK